MRTRRSRPPGFATRRDDESSPEGVIALHPQPLAPATHGTEAATTRNTVPSEPPAALEPQQRETTRPRPPRGRTRSATLDDGNPYVGAATRQFNTRLLEPLHQRYMRLVRDLADEGYDTSMTELVHALLHEGPTTAAQARAKVRAWRQLRASE
jgi:hypothetical protein